MTNIKNLDLSSCEKITDKGLAHLPKSLEKVILYECNNITIAGIETLIENCPSLKELTCSPELNHEEWAETMIQKKRQKLLETSTNLKRATSEPIGNENEKHARFDGP